MLAGAKDELCAVDTLNHLTLFDRGDLNANKDGLTGAAVRYQDWTLDKVGNWPYFYDNSATAQTRLHSAANEITGRRRPLCEYNGVWGNLNRFREGGWYLAVRKSLSI